MPSASQAPCALHSVVGLKVQRADTLGIEGESTFICVLTCALTQNYSVIFKDCGTLICPRCWTFGQFPVVVGTDIIPGGKGFLCRPTASGSGSRLGGVILGCMWAGFRAHGSPAGPPGKEESVSASLAPDQPGWPPPSSGASVCPSRALDLSACSVLAHLIPPPGCVHLT